MQQMPDRIQAIRSELDEAANALEWAKSEFEIARVKYETAREKFRILKQLAQPMMTMMDWYLWDSSHPKVKFAGMELGYAILATLRSRAYEAANATVYGPAKPPYNPWMDLEEIARTLEEGGLDFRTSAPLREVNAALLNLEGKVKDEQTAKYAITEATQILAFTQSLAERGE